MWPFKKKQSLDSSKTADPDRKTDTDVKSGRIHGDPYVELDED